MKDLVDSIPDDPGRRGAVAICVRDRRMLVIRRAPSVVAPLVYCFPGGGIEDDESEEEALVREIREEIGVTVRPLRRLWQCVTAWKVELAWWLAALDATAQPVANPAEVGVIQREVLAQDRLVDVGWQTLSRVFVSL